jgi:peptidoglycan/LPS O-acetylase OafA/YrhL
VTALDGLRGLALAAVLAFHAGFGWAAGGFLGVSTFFTLSGFLITTLVLREHERTGGLDVASFWSRRLRRLLPAALVTVAAVAVAGRFLASPDQAARLRGDLLASLASVVNWRFLDQGRSYGALFRSPSPVLHFWSLAIEAQFYVVFPLVVAAIAVVVGRRRGAGLRVALAVVGAGVAVVGIAAGVRAGTDGAYYSTLARAPELLAGVGLAIAWPRPHHRSGGALDRRWRAAVAVGGVVALPLLVAAWSRTPVGAPGLARGGLALHAVGSALVVAAAATGQGPVAALLGLRPLAWLGRISYAAYLFHWPIFVWLTPDRAGGLHGLPLVALHVALTLVLAALSSRFVERPLRRGRPVLPARSTAALAVATVTAVALAVVVVARPTGGTDPSAAADPAGFRTGVEAAGGVDLTGPSPAGLPRLAVFGDSTALRTAFGLPLWGIRTRRLSLVGDETVIGCGLAVDGTLDATGTPRPVLDECRDWPQRWRRQVADLDLDAAVIQIGPWDTADRRLPGERTWRHLGQPDYDAIVKDQIRTAVDVLSSSGAKVLWLTSPHVEMERAVVPRPTRPAPSSDPARMDRLNALVREVAAERPDTVRVIDVAAHLRAGPGGEMDPAIRPDGVHVSEAAAVDLADWLAPELLAALGDR